MKIGEFLAKNNLSVGDNVKFLFQALGIEDKVDLKKLEEEIGEVSKMSKSKANTVDPEEVIQKYGADTIRLYILFAAPPEKDFEWIEGGIEGAYRFLNRLWDFVLRNIPIVNSIDLENSPINPNKLSKKGKELRRYTHKTIQKFIQEMEKNYQFNTAIAGIMELLNFAEKFHPQTEEDKKALKETIETIIKLLYPITPHICEELWQRLGKKTYLYQENYPEIDEEALKEEEVLIPVQINGKLRDRIKIPFNAGKEEVLEIALQSPKIQKYIGERKIKKVIYVPNKLLNLVL
jgi:leucyl-tRNA synthetase